MTPLREIISLSTSSKKPRSKYFSPSKRLIVSYKKVNSMLDTSENRRFGVSPSAWEGWAAERGGQEVCVGRP